MLVRTLASALSVAFVSLSAQAAPVVDQQQTLFDLGVPFAFNFPGFHLDNLPVGQSFTAGMNGDLAGIQVLVNGQITNDNGTPGAGSFVLDIHAGDGTGGALLGSVTQTQSCDYSVAAGYCWLTFDLSSLGIAVSQGSQYTFDFTSATGPGNFVDRGLVLQTGNPYEAGAILAGPGYGRPDGWDLTFRTLVGSNVTAVPEPSETALLLAGLGLTGAVLRRRRRG